MPLDEGNKVVQIARPSCLIGQRKDYYPGEEAKRKVVLL